MHFSQLHQPLRWFALTIFSAASIALVSPPREWTATAQTASQSVSPEMAQAMLQQAVCLNDWSQAIYAVNLLIGSPSTAPALREQWVRYRRQLQEYQTLRSSFDLSNTPECAGAIAQAQQAAAAPQVARAQPLDWDRATAGFRQSSPSRPQTTAAPTGRSTTASSTARSSANRSGGNDCADLMNPRSGERRVSTGSASSRWNYAIFQASNSQYYLRYWEQADCTRQGETGMHSTEREAYRAFICRHDRERCDRLPN
ncbi:hypothetical protein HNI00_03540 [Thermoleptolyngbya oregonensis NK1-22]|uniref:Uncharacterized protein n=1 Tax=Thermoleptolyngbya oregonensis NK1-22 TaxID=2547457 RepID=A0AA96Y3C7_9CYAN|nr:hypothetical protein [Thermoleptolyngbya oregonensis]WOB42336.1 hypothetical protein HNI00_03540 [Thermoleptolyngbya oregonensis NK1-22]